MAKNDTDHLKQILNILNVPSGKIVLDKNQTIVQTVGNDKLCGFASIVSSAIKKTNSKFKANNFAELIEIEQWLEYAVTVSKNLKNFTMAKSILSELDLVLRQRTFLVNSHITVGDIVMYYSLLNAMNNLSPQEKAQFINVSRWFDNIQQDKIIRQNLPLINFNTNYILSI